MEEGSLAGGVGAAVVESFNDHELLVPVLRLGIGDVLVDHASPNQSKERLGLTPAQMAETIFKRFASSFSPDPRQVVAV
jgi:1-deoxy-D-xylulose-5-phosphate synthase